MGTGSRPASVESQLVDVRLSKRRPARGKSESSQAGESESRWIELARDGDLEAFDHLVRLHFGKVYGLLFRMIGNHEDAEDLAQECFIKAQRSLQWFRGEAAFSTWLYRIAVHQSRDHYRRKRLAIRSLDSALEESIVSRAEGPADESARREFTAGLRECMERLPHHLRAALVLRTQEAMDYEQIAGVLGVNPQTARVQVMKARRSLERWMQPWILDSGESSDAEGSL